MARHSHVFSGFGLDDAAGLAALGCSVIPPPYDASQQWLVEGDVFKGERTTFPQQLVSLPTQNSGTKRSVLATGDDRLCWGLTAIGAALFTGARVVAARAGDRGVAHDVAGTKARRTRALADTILPRK